MREMIIIALIAIITSINAFGQNGYYIQTTKFQKYLTVQEKKSLIQKRFDTLNRLMLYFVSKPDNTIDIILYEYEPAGNKKENKFSLSFNPKANDYYICDCDNKFDVKQFHDMVEKVMDRLDNKKEN